MSTQVKVDLLPCPFCGGEATNVPYKNGKYYEVRCENKDCAVIVFTGVKDTEKEAIEAWNRRADDGKTD